MAKPYTIPAAKRISDISWFQLYSIVIYQDLRTFFNKDPRNSITFWGCSSDNEWFPYYLVNKESKTSKFYLVLPSKTSQDYSRKDECNLIIQKWQMYFQASNFKGRNFLNLNNSKPIQPSYSKEGAWLKYFSLSNSLYAWVTSNLIDSTAHCYTDCCWKEQSNRLKAQVCLWNLRGTKTR